MLSNALARLSMSRFILQIFAIKSRSRRETEQMQKFLAPFFGRDDRKIATADCYRDLPFTVCQSFVEFRLLISVCEA